MFDISWIEICFVGLLALLVIGPKDLPKVFNALAKTIAKAKRMVNDVKGSVAQLEREVDIDAGINRADADWQNLLPDEIRNLPDNFIPGSLPSEYHQSRQRITREHQQATHSINNKPLTPIDCEDSQPQ